MNRNRALRFARLFPALLALLALSGWSRAARADDAGVVVKATDADEPVKKSADRTGEVKEIGLRITNVAKIDVLKETWEFEALLTIAGTSHIRKCALGPIQELFPDGIVKKVDETGEWEDGGKQYRQCKVTVDHESTINVARYPFDEHQLEVTVGDEGDAAEGVEWKVLADPDATGISDKVKLTGWEFGGLSSSQQLYDHLHSKKKLTRVVFELHASRPRASSFIKGFLGVLFQLLIALVALVLSVKAAPNRIALATGALIAVATAHNQISSQVGVSYLTTADKFFFVSYFLLLANILFTAFMLRADEAKNEARAKMLYSTAWLVLPALTVVLSALVLSGVL